MLKRQQGFTLVELVFVIVILGILAAFAIPRYVDLTVSARTASLEGVQGAVRSAAALVKAQAIAEEKDAAATGQSITVEGSTVNLVYGYPANDSIGAALADSSAGGKVTYTAGSTGTSATFELADAPTPANCSFTYAEPASAGAPPTISALTTTGC